MKNLVFLDENLTLFLKNIIPANSFFNFFFSFFSLQGGSIFVWILIVIFVIFLEEKKYPGISKKDKKFIILFFLTLFLSFFISEFFLKNIFKRDRPSIKQYQISTEINSISNNYSFPSSHSTIAFALATTLSFFDKKRKFFYYFLAFIIAYSRIYLGVHYFFDVLAGAIIGIFISKIIKDKIKIF
ncbi:MAG: phosphatase PAP2 family protein [Patescibacteria group bacterium]|nr:phosphatase PAP2 family protein [Patescibacteria group bacterium]